MAIIQLTENRVIGQNSVSCNKEDSSVNMAIKQFIDTIKSPMAKQRAIDALEKQQGFNGQFMRRYIWAINNLKNIDHIDHDKKRIYFKTGTFMLFKDITKTVVNFIEFELAK